LKLVVQSPDSEPREIDVMANVKQLKPTVDFNYDNYIAALREAETERPLRAHRYYENMDDVFIWKMPAFNLEETKVDEIMNRVSNRKALILDLRGNGGGAETTLLRLISHFYNKEVVIGDIQRRKEKKPLLAKKRTDKPFAGQLVVLVDSESGSSSEVFARVMQLEKRGMVVGDQTAGAVMRSKYYDHTIGVDIFVVYGGTITDANLVMTDGKSLEGTGVIPDDLRLPTAADLAGKRDPVLAHAASLVGLKLDPDKAGALFPILWAK
jgi:carboxyl-terminal processing protease